MTASPPVVIVGAGPAGMRAAQALAARGLRPVVVDEAPRAGGQIYRRQPPGLHRPSTALYGLEAGRADALHAAFDALAGRLDHRPDTLVWNAGQGQLDLLHGPTRRGERLAHGPLIVATGATDRVLPLPGWTLPGVYTLGGTQVALKYQACAIGSRVALLGTGPLLYLVAYQYAKAGARVQAVLDTARLADQAHALPAMARQPAVLAKGLYYVAWLRARGIAVHRGVQPLRVVGETRVGGLAWRDAHGRERLTDCDAVGLGHALRPETQLADLLGCRFEWSALQRAHLPVRDAAGRSSVAGVYLAGDGAGIQGADAAEWAGERAALAVLADLGMAIDSARARRLEQRLARAASFRAGLERAFPFPGQWAAQAPDELTVCRCEQITAGQLRQTVRETGADEMNRLKALCRVGMGRCQGRMCGVAAAEILADACARPVAEVGRLRGQAPIKPIPMALATALSQERP